jgi:hypothetical protein
MNDIKIVKFEKDSPFKIKYKTNFDSSVEFEEIFIQQTDVEESNYVNGENTKSLNKKKTRSSMKKKEEEKIFPERCSDVPLKRLYNKRLGLSQNKKKDLQYLLDKHVIPSCYAQFYNSL